MQGGKRLRPDLTLEELRHRFRSQFPYLPEQYKALRAPKAYEVRISNELEQLRCKVVRETTEREIGISLVPRA
jgi:hypothetical protein